MRVYLAGVLIVEQRRRDPKDTIKDAVERMRRVQEEARTVLRPEHPERRLEDAGHDISTPTR